MMRQVFILAVDVASAPDNEGHVEHTGHPPVLTTAADP